MRCRRWRDAGVSGHRCQRGAGVSGHRCLSGAQVLACGVPAPWAQPQFPKPGPSSVAGKWLAVIPKPNGSRLSSAHSMLQLRDQHRIPQGKAILIPCPRDPRGLTTQASKTAGGNPLDVGSQSGGSPPCFLSTKSYFSDTPPPPSPLEKWCLYIQEKCYPGLKTWILLMITLYAEQKKKKKTDL